MTRITARLAWLIVLVSLASSAAVLDVHATPATTYRVSVPNLVDQPILGTEANAHSFDPAISADARYVAFWSFASNLVLDDTNSRADVFVHDRMTGLTERVSINTNGQAGDGTSWYPDINADGRFIAFWSSATNLVLNDTNGVSDVFLHDRTTGVTERVSVDSFGNQGNGTSSYPSVDAEGRLVAFDSYASNLVPGDTNNSCDVNGNGVFSENCRDVFVRDLVTGVTERVSVDSFGNEGAEGYEGAYVESISPDGRFVTFDADFPNLVSDDTNTCGNHMRSGTCTDVFIRDRQVGTTERVSIDSAGKQGNGVAATSDVSTHGRYVVFWSHATNLVPEDTNGQPDVFLHDRQTGATTILTTVSAFPWPRISATGRYAAIGDVALGEFQVFVHDALIQTTVMASVDSDGNPGNHGGERATISGDGRYIAFKSSSTNLVPDDTTLGYDVFVHDLGDTDGDGEWDPFDLCPNNPDCDNDSKLPPGYADCKGACPGGYWRDGVEISIGTSPTDRCADTTMADDEADDKWPPDFDDNGSVNIIDFMMWKASYSSPPKPLEPRADLDASGTVNVFDFGAWKAYFGATCSP
jgi:Tol biopolymer transport system component